MSLSMTLEHMLGACIILLFTSAAASDMCPSGFLQLHPPELVVEYGRSFEVNCSTSQTNSKLKWKTTPELDVNASMVADNLLNLHVESLQEWDTEAICTLNHSDFQCNKSLSLTIYKVPGNVTITLVNHTEVEGDGTPYKLQCDVYDIAPVQSLTVRWYRWNITVNESQFMDNEIDPRNVSDSFEIFPTHYDNGAQYRCEAELDLGPHGPKPPLTVSSKPLHIIIKKTMPITPTSAMTTTVTASTGSRVPTPALPPNSIDIVAVSPGPMADGKNYTLSCNIKIPVEMSAGNVTVKWFIGKDLLKMEIGDSTLEAPWINVTALYKALIAHNGEQYQCAVEFQQPRDNSPTELKSNIINILVYTGCPVTISPASLVVRYGDSALATCSALVPTYGMGWEATVGATGLVEEGTELNWTVKELRQWTVRPQCFINPKDGAQCVKELPVVVYMTPQSLSITANRQGPLAEGIYYFLYCHINNITPVKHLTVKWFKGDTLVRTDNNYTSTTVGPQNVSSELVITPDTSDNGAQYRCETELNLGPGGPPKLTSDPFTITVYSGCPIVLRPSTLVVRYGDSASANCSTFVPHNGIGWNSTLNPVGSMKGVQIVTWSVENLTDWTVESKCVINTDDMNCTTDLHVSVYSVPDNISITASTTGAMAEGKRYILSCHIGNIAPVQNLTVSWFRGDTLLETNDNHQSTAVGLQNVTSDLSIAPNTSDNGAQYRCEAELDLGPGGPPKLTSDPFTITVYSGCPIVLRPSTLVVKYGDSASADCSTFVPHNGIGWNSTLNPVGKMKGVKNSTWGVKNMTEWTVEPKCVIDTGDGQCGTALTVIVYKLPSAIKLTAGHTGEMTEGETYKLTCHIQDVAPVQNLTVNWFKGETLLSDHRHQIDIVDNQKVTSTLHIKPSTSDNGAQYRCEAKLQLGPNSPPPIKSDQHAITVKGNWIPTIIMICIFIFLLLLAVIFLIRYITHRQGNYSVVQTEMELTANGKAL